MVFGKLTPLVTKYFVPLGYVVYAFNYQTTSLGGHISSWKELRQDIHKFLRFVISPKAHVFLYCRSAGCLVILDYILHQYNIQDIIKGNQSIITVNLGLTCLRSNFI
jgi:hypothetical protein